MTNKIPVIAVDGPGGSGKGTLCQVLAKKLGWHLLDSGALYRVLTLAALNHQIDLRAEEKLVSLAEKLEVSFLATPTGTQVILEGENVSESIRHEEIGKSASKIAIFSAVREALLQRQRAFRQAPGLVADGRDMGTVVFPDAFVKIFLQASVQERARRRMQQLQEKGFSVNFARLLAEMKERDQRDSTRSIAPLIAATDAWVIDSTDMSIEEVLEQVLHYVKERLIKQ